MSRALWAYITMRDRLSTRRGLFWSAASSWTTTFLSVAIVTILARLLSPDDFGLVGLATICVALGSVVTTDTISSALVQRRILQDAHVHTAFWGILTLGITITIAAIALAPLVSNLVDEPRLTLVLRIISFRLVLDALFAVPAGLLLRKRDFRSLALRSLIANSGGGIVGIALALLGAGVWALVAQQLAIGVLNVAVCFPRVDWRPRMVFSLSHARDLAPFSTYSTLTRLCAFADVYGARIIIGSAIGVTAVGYYSFAFRIQEMSLAALTGVVTAVTFPLFASRQGRFSELKAILFSSASRTSLVTFPAFLGLAVTAPDLVRLLFGEKWASAIPIIQIMACVSILSTIEGIHESLINAMGRINQWAVLVLCTSIVQVGAYLLTVSYGLTALAASVLILGILVNPIVFWMVTRLVPFRLSDYLKLYGAPFAAAAGMALIVSVLRRLPGFEGLPLYEKVLLELVSGSALYIVLMIALARGQLFDFINYIVGPKMDI